MTRLAYARPDYVHVLIKNNALGVAQKISSLYSSDVCVINELAKFMVAVCRGQSLSVEAFNRDEVICCFFFLFFPVEQIVTIPGFIQILNVCR